MADGQDPAVQDPAELLYRALVDALSDVVLVVTEGGDRYTLVNAAAERVSGYGRDELLALGPAELWAPGAGPPLVLLLGSPQVGGEWRGEWRGERVLRRKDGSLVSLDVTMTWLTLGGRVAYQILARDVTERRRVEEDHRFLAEASALLGSSLDYEETLANVARLAVPTLGDWCTIHRLEDDGTLRRIEMVHADPARAGLVRELLSYPPVPLSAQSRVARALHTGRGDVMPRVPDSYVESISQGPEHLRILRELGFSSWMCAPLVARGRSFGAITFVSGPSGRRYGARDLAVAEDLAGRAALAVDNARLYREAREAIRTRDEFLASASHDLRTPLMIIQGRARLLRVAGGAAAGSERLADGLAAIEAAVARMASQIDEFMDVAQLQMGRPLELQVMLTDLARLVRRVVDRHRRASHPLQVSVEAADGELVGLWDASRLERVLDNLLSTAVKYSPNGGEIGVTLTREDDAAASWAVLRVRDRGLGIPAADLPLVFEQFHRAGNVVGRFIGSGIGLAGSRQIVEQHGGTIVVESREGAGSTFTVRLPLTSPPGAPTPPAHGATSPA